MGKPACLLPAVFTVLPLLLLAMSASATPIVIASVVDPIHKDIYMPYSSRISREHMIRRVSSCTLSKSSNLSFPFLMPTYAYHYL